MNRSSTRLQLIARAALLALAAALLAPGVIHADALPLYIGDPTANEKPASGIFRSLDGCNVKLSLSLATKKRWGNDYMHARYYSPNLGRFLSVDPVGGTVGSSQSWNRYSYVQNSPLGFIDPDGKYGRGTFFTDKQWKAFDKAQKNAAKNMEKRADKLEKKADKLEAKGKSGADERRVEANYLREGAAVLNDDGSNGYYAHAMNSTEYGQYGSENGVAGVFENCDMDIFVNIDHSEFSSGGLGLQRVVAHESMHNIGLSDEPVGADVHGYMRGTPEARNVYRALIGTYMELINPDHLVSFMDPRGP